MSRFVIWSEEHGGWWGPGGWGYVRSLHRAGRYSADEAAAIVEKGNITGTINEVLMPDPWPHEGAP